MMSEISTLVKLDLSDAQKKCTRESSTEKFSNKKAKKTGGKKILSMLKEFIKELLTDVPVPTAEENLEEASENEASIFLQLSNRIDNAKTKNKDASQGLIYSYFDFGEAIFKRYKELKPEHGKNRSKVIVRKEVRKVIPKTKCSDKVLRKRTERSKKIYKLFSSIGKERIAWIRSILPSYVLNITKNEIKYVMAKILTHKV